MKTNCFGLWGKIILLVTIMFCNSHCLFGQELKEVKGFIADASTKEPLSNANILVKGSIKGATSNKDGSYAIQAKSSDILVISFQGYKSQEIKVGNQSKINVYLVESANKLEDVVVIGYGSVKKKDLTGAVGQVKMSDVTKAPVSSYTEALAGRVAGVQVLSQDGQPGGGLDIVIRGANSLTQSNSPLYVIDGFPIENIENAALNPEDIESINVLKDASATAIYGSRAANGVIIIETKKGKVGKPVITFNSSFGYQQLRKKMALMSPYEFVKYQMQMDPLAADSIYFANGKNLNTYKDSAGIDMQNYLFQKGPIQIYNLALRGGNLQTKYSISGAVYDQQGIIINTGFKRYQGRVAIDQTVSPKLKVGINGNYSKLLSYGQNVALGSTGDGQLTYQNNVFFDAWAYRPVSGYSMNLLDQDVDPLYANDRLNPITALENDYTRNRTTDFLANGYINYSITKDLVLNIVGSVRSNLKRNDLFFNSKTYRGRLQSLNIRGVNGSINYNESNTWSNENTLNYTKQFKGNQNLNMMAGFSMQENNVNSNGFAAQNVPNEELGISGLDQGVPYQINSYVSGNGLVSYFGRLNYSYQSKYLFTGTIRADGSSKFADGHKWGYFPSAAFAWNIRNEEFMKSLPIISNLKWRMSYGLTGNNRISDFAYLPQLSYSLGSAYSFNNALPTYGVVASNLGNNNLKWETTAQFDLGLDVGLFNNRIEFTADVYRKKTKDLLLNAAMPITTGFSSAYKNIGKIGNDGLELSLNTINFQTKDFSWSSSFNISFNRNKILELTNGQTSLFSNVPFQSQFNMPLYISQIGQPAGQFWGLVFDGVYQYSDFDNPSPGVYVLKANVPTNGDVRNHIQPGDIKYQDLNGDGIVNSDDRTVIGRGTPIHVGGFGNNLTYKGFDLSIFFQWSYGNQIANANRLMLEGNATQQPAMNQFASYVNRWSPDNPTNENFRAGGQGPIVYSSRIIEDGSYLRLKTLSLGYSLPKDIIKKAYLTDLRFNISTQNLFTITKYSGMDPEVSVRQSVLTPGFDFSSYPQPRTIVFGINATF